MTAFPNPLFLVGSIPLVNTGAVFEALHVKIGDRLTCPPNGETGIRWN